MKPIYTPTTDLQLHGSEENNGSTKENTGSIMMQALLLLQLVKRHILDEAMLICEEIKPVALAVLELCLSANKS